MKLYLLALTSLFLLCSCSSQSLSEAECAEIREKADEIFANKGTREEIESRKSKKQETDRALIASCAAGKTFVRDDYKCFMEATNDPQYTKCLSTAIVSKLKRDFNK